MLDSYFFIPGDKPKFLNKIGELNADFFVIDLEESVSFNNKQYALNNLDTLSVNQKTFVRIPFKENVYSKDQLEFLINKFEGRIVLPKASESKDLKDLISINHSNFSLSLIILVENPTCFINLRDIIKENVKHIHAIGFGSHDFCSLMGMKHNIKHLSYYRNQLILLSKVFGIDYLDGVDLNLKDLSYFEKECKYVFDSGADGKFIIHPEQLKKLNEIEYLSKSEIQEMAEIQKMVSGVNDHDIDVFEFEGKVYEKPHLARIEKLMGKLKRKKL